MESKTTKEVIELLECFICFEMLSKSRMCKLGHTICAKCAGKVKSCPLCDEKITNIENLLLQRILRVYRMDNKRFLKAFLDDENVPKVVRDNEGVQKRGRGRPRIH